MVALNEDFEIVLYEFESIVTSIVESVFSSLSEIQSAALQCLVPLMSFDSCKNKLLQSDFQYRLITLLEKTKDLNFIEDLLKVSNIPTLITWISSYVMEQDDEGSIAAKSSDEHLATLTTNCVDKKVMNLVSKSQDVNVQTAAAKAMAIFFRSPLIRLSVTVSDVLSKFVHMYNSKHFEPHEAALLALSNLVKDNTIACMELGQTPDFIFKLIGGLEESESITLLTLDIIKEFVKHDALRTKLYEFDIIPKIIELSVSPSERVLAKLLYMIPLLVTSDYEITLFQQADGIEIIFSFLKSTCSEVRKAATISIGLLAENAFAAEILFKNGWLKHLYLMQSSEDQCSGYAKIAIKHILDANLVLKFAMTGILDYSDITGDAFYDVGPMKTPEHLKIAQIYSNKLLNNSVPTWLLNITEAGTLDSDGFQLPYDTELRTFVKSSRVKISETSDLKEKIRILAAEVVNYFGGPMAREDAYSSIDWQKITKYRCHFNTNVVPIGLPESAGYRHRALLFKFVADKVGIVCRCVCGEYQIAYNTICIQNKSMDKLAFVVNLMENPGEIYPADSKEANDYCRI
nr:armadillo repeat containing protein 3 [Hymenolepis microstoma]